MKTNGMILMLMLTCMWCSSCEKEPVVYFEPNEPEYVSPELEDYLEEFVMEAELRGVDLELSGLIMILESVTRPDNNGSCQDKVVTIDQEAYDAINRLCYRGVTPFLDWRFKLMIFHQLGHCLLYRQHLDETDAEGIPLSIMHTSAVPDLELTGLDEELFFDELFSNANL